MVMNLLSYCLCGKITFKSARRYIIVPFAMAACIWILSNNEWSGMLVLGGVVKCVKSDIS